MLPTTNTAGNTAMAIPAGPAPARAAGAANAPLVRVQGLTMAFGSKVIQHDLSFDVRPAEVLVIMGGSGCGKSTLLRTLVGLHVPAAGQVLYGSADLYQSSPDALARLRRSFGVMFQAGALWSSMSVGDNVMLPLQLFTDHSVAECSELARTKLALVGLSDSFDVAPSALSGGMRKRAAIARALALDPPLLYLDEPSAGLDPPTSARLDALILQLRNDHHTAVVMVTHELASIFAVADRALFLDAKTKTMTALDAPKTLRDSGPPAVQAFLRRDGAA